MRAERLEANKKAKDAEIFKYSMLETTIDVLTQAER